MDLLLPGRFHDPATLYGYVGTVFDQISSGDRPATVSITPSARHVGVTRRDTLRPGFARAVGAARGEGYPVLVRGSGGGAIAADRGTFGFSIMRPADRGESRRNVYDRYDEAADLVLAAFARLGLRGAEAGSVRDEFCPGDHSIRVGSRETGMKLVGIAQRVTRRATSVGGIVLVAGDKDLARVLGKVYAAMDLPFRPGSVGSARKAGVDADVETFVEVFAAEAEDRYGATRTPLDAATRARAHERGPTYVTQASGT